MLDDATLLERYARDRSEEAFTELVRRHLTLVYSAALRRCDGDAHRAQDVAQIVFIGLARDAAALSRHPALVGWLYAATRNAAIDLLRAERRRRQREEKAQIMQEISSSPETPTDWEQLRPVLDDVMDELGDQDREAVLLRFFKNQPFASVAAALRVSEDTARKRVDRALEKLGGLLQRRGITSTSGALAVLLTNQVATAAPASVAASITTAAIAGAGAATGASAAGTAGIFIMSTSKIVTGVTVVIALVAIGSAVYFQAQASRETAAIATITAERDALLARTAAAEKRAEQSEASLTATQKELGALRAAPKSAEAPAPNQPASQNPALDYVLEHPEMHAAFVEQNVLRAKMRYDAFFKKAGLSAEQQERVLSALKDSRTAELDMLAALHAQGHDRVTDEDLQKVAAMVRSSGVENMQRREAALRATLGDAGFTAFKQYAATIPQRNVAEQLAGQLYNTSEPLTSQQAEQLVEILAQNEFKPRAGAAPGNTVNGTVVSDTLYYARSVQAGQQAGMSTLDWQAPVTDAALARAQSVLTPAQFAALKQMQADQAMRFQLAPPVSAAALPSTIIMISHGR